jgi:hypothetical protein
LTLSQSQRDALQIIVSVYNGASDQQTGAYGAQIYNQIIQDVGFPVYDDSGVVFSYSRPAGFDQNVWNWLQAAAGVNADTSGWSLASAVIRADTTSELTIRYGTQTNAAGIEQQASNAIAIALATTIK